MSPEPPLDANLLDRARHAAAALEDAERRALLARAEYHTAVRRLHLAGGTLRDIAAALSLSHQRVQQIVSGAGGTWWRRAWRTRRVTPDAVCSWCGRPPSEVGRLIAGPHVYICDACVASADAAVRGEAAGGPFEAPRKGPSASRCAFCGKLQHGARLLARAPAGRICTECLGVCKEIIT